MFEDAWDSRPCLVLSPGFYEYRSTNGGPKRPYRIYREDDPAFAMAGLWDVWEGDEETIPCVTILTTEPNDVMAPIHDRMPVVLPENAESDWLSAGPAERTDLCRPYPGDDLDAYEISTRVNDPPADRAKDRTYREDSLAVGSIRIREGSAVSSAVATVDCDVR